ncbi:MAG: inorganic diphosphatase [Bacteroidota bacterium]
MANQLSARLIIYLIFTTFFFQCKRDNGFERPREPYGVATLAEGGKLNMIVEIPAGTNDKFEYDSERRKFVHDTLPNGTKRRIQFLPYPGNYGFIPSTLMDKERGGDGDPLDVLVVGQHAPMGSLIAVEPIGALLLKDRGELDTKIIAVPADVNQRSLPASTYMELLLEYPAAHRIIEEWFLNYKGPKQMELIRWEDETYAWDEINKWRTE